MINLGYACINETLKQKKISVNRSMIMKTFLNKGEKYAKELIKKNLNDMKKIIKWNYENKIYLYRMSSDTYPHLTNTKLYDCNESRFCYLLDEFEDDFKEIGNMAKKYNQRLTFHPGQFSTHLGSPNNAVVKKCILDLDMHAHVMDLMNLNKDSVIVIHAGGTYKNKTLTLNRLKNVINKLDDSIKNRLVIENCERNYCSEDLIPVCEELNVPHIFDTHHYDCYQKIYGNQKTPDKLIPKIMKLWNKRGIKPKFHVSNQAPDKRIGAHSDYIDEIPKYILDIPKNFNQHIDVMLECKKKELALFKVKEKYSF